MSRQRNTIISACVALALAAALGYSAVQSSLARDTGLSPEARARAARRAATLRPWDRSAASDAAELTARVLAEQGRLRAARRLLLAAWHADPEATRLRSEITSVSKAIERLDARKAHVQHGREGPAGELDPEDVLR